MSYLQNKWGLLSILIRQLLPVLGSFTAPSASRSNSVKAHSISTVQRWSYKRQTSYHGETVALCAADNCCQPHPARAAMSETIRAGCCLLCVLPSHWQLQRGPHILEVNRGLTSSSWFVRVIRRSAPAHLLLPRQQWLDDPRWDFCQVLTSWKVLRQDECRVEMRSGLLKWVPLMMG